MQLVLQLAVDRLVVSHLNRHSFGTVIWMFIASQDGISEKLQMNTKPVAILPLQQVDKQADPNNAP